MGGRVRKRRQFWFAQQTENMSEDKKRKQQVQYCCSMDNDLLKYVQLNQCWDIPHGRKLAYWEMCAKQLDTLWKSTHRNHLHGNSITAAGVQKRFNTLVKHFKAEESEALYRSGTEEEF